LVAPLRRLHCGLLVSGYFPDAAVHANFLPPGIWIPASTGPYKVNRT
jgi:hypothetical protein